MNSKQCGSSTHCRILLHAMNRKIWSIVILSFGFFFPQYAHRYFPVGDGYFAKKTATVIAASRILRWHCFKCKIPSSAITLHMIFFPSGTFLFFIIYSAIFPPDTGIFLPPQKNAAALYAFCSIFYSYGICLCQCCNFLYFNFCFYSL